MIKRLTAVAVLSAFLAACGGGDDNASTPANTGPAIKLTYSGSPLVPSSSKKARAMASVDASASSPVVPESQDTINRLQDAFKARGADIGVYPGIINGSKLHDIVTSVNNGEAPTSAEMAAANVNISTWTLVNFQYDDMTGYVDTPEKQAAAAQFYKDIRVFAAREYIKGNVVYFARPILSCLPDKLDASGNTLLTSTLSLWIALGGGDNIGHSIGGIRPTPDQMGGDCQTPDATAQASYIDSVVDPLVADYKTALDTIGKCKHNPEAIPENERAAQCWGITPDKK